MAKANMSLTKNPMPEQEPLVRNHNFEEVALGYTRETAMDEATRDNKYQGWQDAVRRVRS